MWIDVEIKHGSFLILIEVEGAWKIQEGFSTLFIQKAFQKTF